MISPSILTRIGKLPSENWVPPKEFLLGLGQPWEPDPWEYDDEAEESVLVAASQHIDELVTKLHSKEESSSRWSSPKCDEKLKKIRQGGIPKQMQKQTDWAVSVWVQWASYRCEKIIEESKKKHPLLTNFVAMSEDGLKFWLVKFVAEVRRSDGKPYPPNSLYQMLWTRACSACC